MNTGSIRFLKSTSLKCSRIYDLKPSGTMAAQSVSTITRRGVLQFVINIEQLVFNDVGRWLQLVGSECSFRWRGHWLMGLCCSCPEMCIIASITSITPKKGSDPVPE